MNQLTTIEHGETAENSSPEPEGELQGWQLKKLKPLHKQVASLVAQGFKNVEIAAMVNITPEYVSMLLRQPLVKAYVEEMNSHVETRMEALFEQSVDVIASTMRDGNNADKLKAARLQMEATKRIGRPDPNAHVGETNVDRLTLLAERLIQLQSGVRKGSTFNENGEEVTDV